MKKLLSIMLALALVFPMGTIAFAAEENQMIPSASSLDNTGIFFEGGEFARIQHLAGTRSTSVPDSYWNLAENNYSADLQIVGKSWLYTNYYYHPNGSGRIYVDYNVTADTSTTTLYIGLYDLTKAKLVVEHVVNDVRTTGKTGSMYFYNLTPSHNYAVCFRAHPSSLNGSATIKH